MAAPTKTTQVIKEMERYHLDILGISEMRWPEAGKRSAEKGFCLGQPTIEDLQKIYERSGPGEMPCYYDGSLCKRGEEFCSVKSETCESVFPRGSSKDEKLAICEEIISKNTQEQGKYDTCVFFLGELTLLNHSAVSPDNQGEGSHVVRGTGKEFCPPANESCQLGKEVCNSTSKKCDPLFPDGLSDEDKRLWCRDVIKKNITALLDGCKYALGLLDCPKTAPVAREEPVNAWGISVTVILLAVVVAAGTVLFFWYKKICCFKSAEVGKHTGPESSPDGNGNDVNVRANRGRANRERANRERANRERANRERANREGAIHGGEEENMIQEEEKPE